MEARGLSRSAGPTSTHRHGVVGALSDPGAAGQPQRTGQADQRATVAVVVAVVAATLARDATMVPSRGPIVVGTA